MVVFGILDFNEVCDTIGGNGALLICFNACK